MASHPREEDLLVSDHSDSWSAGQSSDAGQQTPEDTLAGEHGTQGHLLSPAREATGSKDLQETTHNTEPTPQTSLAAATVPAPDLTVWRAFCQQLDNAARQGGHISGRDLNLGIRRKLAAQNPEWAREILRPHLLEEDNELGCWIFRCNGVNKYYEHPWIKIWNIDDPVHGRQFGADSHVHNLALVAAGHGQHLGLIGNRSEWSKRSKATTYAVSHLCHNTRCCNPGHVIVETAQISKDRKSCKGHFVIVTADGSRYHPCCHVEEASGRSCILPERLIPSFGKNFRRGQTGLLMAD